MSEASREPAGLGCQSRAGGTGLGQSRGQCQGHRAVLGGHAVGRCGFPASLPSLLLTSPSPS